MLYAPIGSMKPTRVQGAFVSDDEVEAVTEFIKNNTEKQDYDQSVMDTIEREAELCGNKKATTLGDGDEEANDGDPMLKPAIQLAVESGKISTSLIQRRLQLGYGRAAKLIDTMEDMGIVGPPQGQKPREVLISKQEYMEMELRRE
ncbi:MAG: DNA translocase FtsK [Eubacteriales bacterium]